MSDLAVISNRILPITLELYDEVVEEFPDKNVIGANDSNYKIEVTLTNKDATSPYAVGASVLSSVDKVEYYFKSPTGTITAIKASIDNAGSGITSCVINKLNLNLPGIWILTVVVVVGDDLITYPPVPIYVV